MARFLFLAIYLLGILYFTCRRRNFDAFSMAFFGAAVYFFPAVLGYGSYSSLGQFVATDLHPESYMVLVVAMAPIIVGSLLNDSRRGRSLAPEREPGTGIRAADRMTLRVVLALAVFFLLLTIRGVGLDAFSMRKSDLSQQLGRDFVLFRNLALFGLVASAALRMRAYKYTFLALLLVELALGFRSFLFLGVAAILWMRLTELGPLRVVTRGFKYSVAGAAIVVFFTVLKGYLGGVRQAGMEYVRMADFSWDYLVKTMSASEPFVIMNNLNMGLFYRFDQPGFDFLRGILVGIFPFAVFIAPESASRSFSSELFPEIDYGVAFSPWLDAFSVGGWALLLAFAALYAATLPLINRFMASGDWIARAAVFGSAISWCTYIHRNSISYELTAVRRLLLIAVAAYLIRYVLLRMTRRKRRA